MLSNQSVGTYLVRFTSSRPDALALEFVEVRLVVGDTFVARTRAHPIRRTPARSAQSCA